MSSRRVPEILRYLVPLVLAEGLVFVAAGGFGSWGSAYQPLRVIQGLVRPVGSLVVEALAPPSPPKKVTVHVPQPTRAPGRAARTVHAASPPAVATSRPPVVAARPPAPQ